MQSICIPLEEILEENTLNVDNPAYKQVLTLLLLNQNLQNHVERELYMNGYVDEATYQENCRDITRELIKKRGDGSFTIGDRELIVTTEFLVKKFIPFLLKEPVVHHLPNVINLSLVSECLMLAVR